MYSFDYARPVTVAEALTLLRSDVEPRLLAGGQTLLPAMKHRLTAHSTLIDLQGIDTLRGITLRDRALRIGAMTRHADVASAALVKTHLPALAILAEGIADPLVRNMGTIGGSLANNDPAADYPAAVLGLGATLHTDRRDIAADDFFQGMFQTALARDEILTAVTFPLADTAGYFKLRHPASGYVLAGAFVARFGSTVRLAINGAGPCVFRDSAAEAALAATFHPDTARALSFDATDFNQDLHAGRDYRARVLPHVIRRAVTRALA
jgi:carbon-monoxide dehydrogenase medium subunit